MKHLKKIILLILLVTTLTSCDWLMDLYGIRKKRNKSAAVLEQESTEIFPQVESTELAKLIIKPTPKPLRVERDPFKPLLEKKSKIVRGDQGLEVQDDMLENVDFLGVVRIGNNFSALLRTSETKGAFNLGENVGSFKITEISQDYVIFTKGEKTYKIKRGDEK